MHPPAPPGPEAGSLNRLEKRILFATATSTGATAAAASVTSITIPVGWRPIERGTNLYAVPIIITVSVVVAVSLVSTIVGTVVWRRRSRRRRHKKRDPPAQTETNEPKAQIPRRKPAAAVSAAAAVTVGSARSLRQRRKRRAARAARRAGDDGDEEASEALTGGSRSSVPESLTQRLAARIRRDRSATNDAGGPSTVFSRDLERVDSRSSHGSASLARTDSRMSVGSLRTIPSQTQQITNDIFSQQTPAHDSRHSSTHSLSGPGGLPLPATSPPLAPGNSSFGQFFHNIGDVSLPAFGPPAYRPNSSTIQATTRGLAAMLPTRANRRAGRRSLEVDEERGEHVPEDVLLWPEEKRQLQANRRALGTVAPHQPPIAEAPDDGSAPPEHETEPDRSQVDRSEYSAHIATDDKAVLARLSEQAQHVTEEGEDDEGEARAGPSSRLMMTEASAPAPEDEGEVDEDGFERLPISATVPTIVIDEPSLLPAPSEPIVLRSTYSAAPATASSSSPFDGNRAHPQGQSPPSTTALGKRAEARRSALELEDEQHDDEESFLPVYLPRATELATAPPADDDDDDDDDEMEQNVGHASREREDEEEEDLYAQDEPNERSSQRGAFAGRQEHVVI